MSHSLRHLADHTARPARAVLAVAGREMLGCSYFGYWFSHRRR